MQNKEYPIDLKLSRINQSVFKIKNKRKKERGIFSLMVE